MKNDYLLKLGAIALITAGIYVGLSDASETQKSKAWQRPEILDSLLSYKAKNHHVLDKNGQTREFRNNYYFPEMDKSFADLMKWNMNRESPVGKPQPSMVPDYELVRSPAPQGRITWFGHSTFLIQLDTLNILTDAQFSDRASPFQWIGPIRYTPLAFHPDSLPNIHLQIISHDHYDHLDHNTQETLAEKFPNALVVTGLKLDEWFKNEGVQNTLALDWWQSATPQETPNLRITAVPVQHWSKRNMIGRNQTLWAGYVLEFKGKRIFFAGDTGYGPDFKDIGKVYPDGFDLALIPIGAYAPRWFMKAQHCNPEEAVKIHQDIGSRFSLGMHWGTFVLTDEPVDEPPKRLAKALDSANISKDRFLALVHGQTLSFDEFPKDEGPILADTILK